MTRKEIETRKAKRAADEIIRKWQIGYYSTKQEAHEELNRLNGVIFDMYDFGLAVINPGEIQEYIHGLQDKYTVEIV